MKMSNLEYVTYDPSFDYAEGESMNTFEIVQGLRYHAEKHGIELQIPAVLSDFDLEDVVYEFSVYDQGEFAQEMADRYVHASLTAA